MRRALPALLLAATAVSDGAGEHTLALYLLLAAIPASAAAGLGAYGELLDGKREAARQLQALLWPVALALILASTAVRAPAVHDAAVPALAVSALVAALAVLALEALLGAGHVAVERRPRQRPAADST